MYIQEGEQSGGPGATRHILHICGKYIGIDSGMGIQNDSLGGNYFPAETAYSRNLDLILLTHDHIDHSGGLPALVRDNPEAKVLMTRPTMMGAEIMLNDSLKIHDMNQKAVRRAGGSPVPFIYSTADIYSMFSRTGKIAEAGWYEIWSDWQFGFYSAGHDRGAMMTFIVPPEGPAYLITGDVCSHDQPTVKGVMLPPREFFGNLLDGRRIVIITETTYGNHEMSKSFEELWSEFGEFTKKMIRERHQILLPSFSKRAPNLVKFLSDSGIQTHIDGMARDIVMLHSKDTYSWCDQDIKMDIDRLIKTKMAVLYRKLDGKNSQEEHQLEASHRLATDAGCCCGMNYSPIISSSAMMDKGMSVKHGEHILPNRDGAVVFTGYMFPGSVGDAVLKMKRGDTVKLRTWDPGKRQETEKPVPVSCEVHRFGLSGHDTADKLAERIRRMHEICPVEAVIGHHGDADAYAGFARRVKAFNLNIPVFHGAHLKELPL